MTTEKDIEYLDKEFPKEETKFRGQTMILLSLAREEGKQQAKQEMENSKAYLELIERGRQQATADFIKKIDGMLIFEDNESNEGVINWNQSLNKLKQMLVKK